MPSQKTEILEHRSISTVKKYDKTNFFKHTYCVFKGVSLKEISRRKPHYRSESGSSYYYTKKGVYRLSNHWGRAAKCNWRLISEIPVEIDDLRLGYADWTDFRENVSEDIDAYYVSIDFDKKIVTYKHKDNPDYDQKAVLRPVNTTRKLIKQIKNLLETHKWAKYYEYDDLDKFREEIILELINTDNSLNDIRRELAEY